MGMTLNAGVETYDILDQRQLAIAAATIYTVPGSTQAFIKSIHVVNNDTAPRTFQLFANGTAEANAITPAITLTAGGWATYGEHGWRIFTSAGESFAIANPKERKRLTGDQTVSQIALLDIPGLTFTLLANKVYTFKAVLFRTSNALTVGMYHGVNFTGTTTYIRVGEPINPVAQPAVGGNAAAIGSVATAVATKVNVVTAAGTGPVIIFIEGIIEVGASGGTFSIQHGSETATLTTTQRGSWAEVEEIA